MTWGRGKRGGTRSAIPLILAALLVLAACSNDEPSPSATSSPTPSPTDSPSPSLSPSPSPSPTVAPTAVAKFIVYEDIRSAGSKANELFLYTVATDSVRQLTNSVNRSFSPEFIDSNRISYVERANASSANRRDSLMELRLDTAGKKRLFQAPVGAIILAHAWSPGRTTIAYWLQLFNGSNEIHLFTVASKSDRRIRSIGKTEGRGVGASDEVNISWNLDGTAVLGVNTFADTGPTMVLTRGTGANVIAPRSGTFARYTRDGKRIIYRDFSLTSTAGSWYSVTAPGDVRSSLAIRRRTNRPGLSPDGGMVATDDATNQQVNPAIWVYTFSSRASRRIGTGIAPIWLSSTAIAASNTVRCTNLDEAPGCEAGWRETGSAQRYTLTGGSKRLKLVTTFDAAVFYQ